MIRAGVAVVLGLLVAAGVVHAAPGSVQTTTPGGQTVRLDASDGAAGRCYAVAVGDGAGQVTAPCEPVPDGARQDVAKVHVTHRTSPERLSIVYGTLSAETASLELRLDDGRRLRVSPQGPDRLYVHALGGDAFVAAARALDAAGRTLAAADLDVRELKPLHGPVTLGRLRDERNGSARLRAFVARVLEPLPNAPMPRRARACVAVDPLRSRPAVISEPGRAGGGVCAPVGRLRARLVSSCQNRRVALYGLAPLTAARLDLVLEGGRVLRIRMRALPRSWHRPARAFGLSLPAPSRLLRLDSYRADGRPLVSAAFNSDPLAGC